MENKKEYYQINAYGKEASVEVAPTNTRDNWHTISLSMSPKSTNSKTYNHKNKITVQVTQPELPIIIAAFLRVLPECEYTNHGDDNKAFSLLSQEDGTFIRVSNKHSLFACKIPSETSMMMGTLALTQYTKNFQGLTTDTALTTIRILASQLKRSNSYPKISQHKRKSTNRSQSTRNEPLLSN